MLESTAWMLFLLHQLLLLGSFYILNGNKSGLYHKNGQSQRNLITHRFYHPKHYLFKVKAELKTIILSEATWNIVFIISNTKIGILSFFFMTKFLFHKSKFTNKKSKIFLLKLQLQQYLKLFFATKDTKGIKVINICILII